MSITLQAAQAYLQEGWSVIPVGKDKKPVIESWKEYQSRLPTQEEITNWFSDGKNNIAIVTGKVSNLAVVDVDTKNGGTPRGLPPTLISKTQSGGFHFFYKYIDGLRNSVGVRQGVDIRADGGFVVAAPSVGLLGEYEWVTTEDPQPFPLEYAQAAGEYKRTNWEEVVGGVPTGSRNEVAAKVIGKLIFAFKDPNEWGSIVWLMATQWNQTNKPPLGENELRAIFNSITSRELRKAKETVPDEETDIVLISDAAKTFKDTFSAKYPTGFTAIDDNMAGGITEGDLIVIVGSSGHGKTTLAQSITYNLVKGGVACLWFSFEVVMPELWKKFEQMGVPESFAAYTPLRNATGKIDWVKKMIVKARDVYKTNVVFVDHLGFLMPSSGYDKNMTVNYATYMGMLCRELKTIAIQERIAIVLLWHNRKLPSGSSEDPELNDIKDSSGIAQEADAVFNINREKAEDIKRGYMQKSVEELYSQNSIVKFLKNRRTGALKRFRVELKDYRLIESGKTSKEMEDDAFAKAYEDEQI